MTRVVTGAALVGILQGIVLVLLLGPLGLSSLTGGWVSYSGTYSSSVAFTTTPTLPPLLAVPLVTTVLAACAASIAQQRGWLGPRPAEGRVVPARLGVAAVLVAAAGHALAPRSGTTVAFGRAREAAALRYADFVPALPGHAPWTVVCAAGAAAVALVVLAAVREHRARARGALVAALALAIAGLVAQLTLLDGLAVEALACDVLALLLGVAALVSARRPPTGDLAQ